MAETPWIIDAWVLLRPIASAPGNREGESIFGRYGQLGGLPQTNGSIFTALKP